MRSAGGWANNDTREPRPRARDLGIGRQRFAVHPNPPVSQPKIMYKDMALASRGGAQLSKLAPGEFPGQVYLTCAHSATGRGAPLSEFPGQLVPKPNIYTPSLYSRQEALQNTHDLKNKYVDLDQRLAIGLGRTPQTAPIFRTHQKPQPKANFGSYRS